MKIDILSSYDIHKLFEDKKIFRQYIYNIFDVVNSLKIEAEYKFDFVFKVYNKKKTNFYLLVDYRVLIKALLLTSKEFINSLSYERLVNMFDINDADLYFDSVLNLLYILSKKELVYLNNLKRISAKYKYTKKVKNDRFVICIDAIALNYKTIKNELIDDKEVFMFKVKQHISSDYTRYYKRKSMYIKKHHFSFSNSLLKKFVKY